MKTAHSPFPTNAAQRQGMLDEVNRCAVQSGLNDKQALQLMLLADELAVLIPGVFRKADGVFWMENHRRRYELHAAPDAAVRSLDQYRRLLSVSSTGRNAAGRGIGGKIRCGAQKALLSRKTDPDAKPWDGLERSMIANFADDVIVSISGGRAEITVVKSFLE